VSPRRTPSSAARRVGRSTSATALGGGAVAAGMPGCNNPGEMEGEPRRLRADAERNRRRLIDAATELFRERGLEVGVGEIAEHAEVGRGTLFRNFPSKDALVVAVVVERIKDSVQRGRSLLTHDDPAAAAFALVDDALERQAADRALFEALAGDWMAHPEIHAAHNEMLAVVEQILHRAQAVGAIRADVSGVDVMLAVKGVCEVQRVFPGLARDVGRRQLELLKARLAGTELPLAEAGRASA
jgi:AcrR family transcriptional regulator